MIVTEHDSKVIGYIHLSDYECTYFDSLKNILTLVVDKNYHRNGIGRKLIERAEDWAKENNSKGIRLISGEERISAHKFYSSLGYNLRKVQKNFIKSF